MKLCARKSDILIQKAEKHGVEKKTAFMRSTKENFKRFLWNPNILKFVTFVTG